MSTVMADYCTVNNHTVDITKMPYAATGLHPCQYAGTIDAYAGAGSDTTE
jgi:hypothetical protein